MVSFTCKSKSEKLIGRPPLGASAKQNVGGGGGPWCVAAQSWAAVPATLTDMSGL